MNVTLEKLTIWNQFAQLTRNTAISARVCYARGERQKAAQQLADLEAAAAACCVSLEAAGAERPRSLPAPVSVPLVLLDTPASRRYARLMREAYAAAREVDHERGYGDDGPADVLEGFAEAAEMDVFGPVGAVRE